MLVSVYIISKLFEIIRNCTHDFENWVFFSISKGKFSLIFVYHLFQNKNKRKEEFYKKIDKDD